MSSPTPTIYCDNIEVPLKTGPDIRDITQDLATLVQKSKIENGTLHATVIGSTGSITTIEYEPGVVEDLKRAIRHTLSLHDALPICNLHLPRPITPTKWPGMTATGTAMSKRRCWALVSFCR